MEEILQKLLSKMEQNPNASIENLIHDNLPELDLTQEDLKELTEVFNTLDTIHDNAVDLAKKKESGMTRTGWIEERLSSISDTGDASEIVIPQIVEGVKSGMNDTISQEV